MTYFWSGPAKSRDDLQVHRQGGKPFIATDDLINALEMIIHHGGQVVHRETQIGLDQDIIDIVRR